MRPLSHPHGFSLMAALFMIIAVLLVAAAMIGTTLSRSSSTVLGLRASQALYAARAGLQVASAQALSGGCAAVSASLNVEGMTVDLSCTAQSYQEGAATLQAYDLTARAFQGRLSDNSFVSRRVRAQVGTSL